MMAPNPILASGAWVEIALAIDMAASPPAITFSVNRAQAALDPKEPLYPLKDPTDVQLGVGIAYADTGGQSDVWYDDVTLQVMPP